MSSPFLFLAALTGFLGVALGAFGAHGLHDSLSASAMEIYKTAVSYQMWHALALGLIGVIPTRPLLRWAGWFMMLGIALFSGSLYILTVFNIHWLGYVTPFGGLALLAGWGLLAYASRPNKRE